MAKPTISSLSTVIWEIATITTEGGLEDIADMIQELVLPSIIATYEESKLMFNMEREHQLDSMFTANGQEDGVPPILPPHVAAGVYGQYGPRTLPAVGMTPAPTVIAAGDRKSILQKISTLSKKPSTWLSKFKTKWLGTWH